VQRYRHSDRSLQLARRAELDLSRYQLVLATGNRKPDRGGRATAEDETSSGDERSSLRAGDRAYGPGRRRRERCNTDPDRACALVSRRPAHSFPGAGAVAPSYTHSARIDDHLAKVGNFWELEIPAGDTKTGCALDYRLSKEFSARIDLYLERFRGSMAGTDKHAGLWPSLQSRPMCSDAIYGAVYRRTKDALGFGVNLHRFRHAAASFWSSHDPVNVRGVKDLLGQASFKTTEAHYIMAQSRLAGRTLARVIGDLAKKSA